MAEIRQKYIEKKTTNPVDFLSNCCYHKAWSIKNPAKKCVRALFSFDYAEGETQMQELSLNILDIAENSIKAGAPLITIEVEYSEALDRLRIAITDNGCGMSPEQVKKVTDPFFTSRTTRRVGMGLPLFQMAAEMAGGSITVESTLGKGTRVEGVFQMFHIDRLPMGDLAATLSALIGMNPERDFVLQFTYNDKSFRVDTHDYRAILGVEVSLAEPEVLQFVREQVRDGIAEVCPDPGIL